MTALEILDKSNPTILENVSWSGINLEDKKVEFGISLGDDYKQEVETKTVPTYKRIMITNHVVCLQENLSPVGLKIVYKELRKGDLVFNIVEGEK